MGKRIYFEDAASIALLYNYKVTKRNMLSLNRVKEFDSALDKKLDEMNSNVQCVYPLDCSKLIYFYTQDENDKEYLILKHDFDYEKAEHDLLQFPLDIYKAIRDNEVLKVLNIEVVDGELKKIEDGKVKKKSIL